MATIERDTCLSCLGAGEVSSERGLARCPDCDGTGSMGSLFRRNEQRIRQVEARAERLQGEVALDVQWLVGELRRYRVTLLASMSAAQEMGDKNGNEAEALLHRIQFDANDVLGIYSPKDE